MGTLESSSLSCWEIPQTLLQVWSCEVRIRVAQAQWISKSSRMNCHDSNLVGIQEISQEVPILERADKGRGGRGVQDLSWNALYYIYLNFMTNLCKLPTPGRTFRPVRWKNSATGKKIPPVLIISNFIKATELKKKIYLCLCAREKSTFFLWFI